MQRALELAALGKGQVSPNPMVGCVIVHGQEIIGEGYHQKHGGPHAEVNAINSVTNSELLLKSTVYVTLEPCAHFGKTPPCSDLLIEKEVKKVVIACEDPFEQVDGKGIKKLRAAGISVETGILEEEARDLNKRFFTFHQRKRPYVVLKWARTSDGFIARENYDSKWISNSNSRQLVHKWRTEEDAILVGKNTAIHDNPALTAREWSGRSPVRVLLDRNLQVLESSHLFDNEAKTLVLNEKNNRENESNRWIKLNDINPKTILDALYEQEIQSVIIEGGGAVLNSFIQENCWDEARIFTSDKVFEKGIPGPETGGEIVHEETIFGDHLKILKNTHG